MSRRDRAQAMESWRGSLLRLPDDLFFDIMRNYLGELKTPFNKQSLVEELSSFLASAKSQARILAQIDEMDARVLTAIGLLGKPSLDRLFSLFDGTMSYLELHYLLLNFQERLLVYIEGDGRSPRLHLNPFLEPVIEAEIVDPQLLFPSMEGEVAGAAPPWPSDSLLVAFFSFLSAAPDLLKADGRLKKRAAEEIAAVFPGLAAGRARLLLGACARLGLLAEETGVVRAKSAGWRSFARLAAHSRRALLWAALVDASGSEAPRPGAEERSTGERPLSNAGLEGEARMLASFLANLEEGRVYPAPSLERMLRLFSSAQEREEGGARGASLLAALAALGLLVTAVPPKGATGEAKWYALNPGLRVESLAESRTVIVEPNFQMTIKPSVDFEAGLVAASIAEIRRFDFYPRYEITKRAFLRSLEGGNSAGEIIALLERLGENTLPQNLRFSMSSWEKEFRGLALYRGIVLTADSERRHLIEHSEPMKPWIRGTLGPGIYLLDEEHVVEWSRALSRAGIDPLPSVRTVGGDGKGAALPFSDVGEPLRLVSAGRRGEGPRSSREARKTEGTEELAKSLHEALERLELPPEIASELAARINKKLILFPRQLDRALAKAEKNEAKGLDYIGKVRLVEQALKSGSELLEVLERTAKGSSRRLLVRPLLLRKSGNDLLLEAQTLPEAQTVQIVIRKIALLRKLKSSLYAP